MIDVTRIYSDIKDFAGTSHPELAEAIAQQLCVLLCPREIIRFPNDNIFVRLLTSVRGQDVFIRLQNSEIRNQKSEIRSC